MRVMKAAVYDPEVDDIRIAEVPVPTIGEGEILLRPQSVGLCASELIPSHLKKGGSLGHELAGIVQEVGGRVKGISTGDRIFILHHVPCLNCHFCRRGFFTMCEDFGEFGFDPTGYAEYTRIKERHTRIGVLKLPDSVSFDEGCLIEPISSLVSAVRKSRVSLTDTVLVMGAGFIGLVAVQLFRILGSGPVVVVDNVPEKLESAIKHGADVVIDRDRENVLSKLRVVNDGRRADVVFNTAPAIRAAEESIALAKKGGTVMQFGGTSPHESIPIVPYDFIKSELSFIGVYSGSHIDAHIVLSMLAQKKLVVRDLVTDHFPLDRLREAIVYKRGPPRSLKVVIKPNG
jgi:L-iditol 2-dehydrogenase